MKRIAQQMFNEAYDKLDTTTFDYGHSPELAKKFTQRLLRAVNDFDLDAIKMVMVETSALSNKDEFNVLETIGSVFLTFLHTFPNAENDYYFRLVKQKPQSELKTKFSDTSSAIDLIFKPLLIKPTSADQGFVEPTFVMDIHFTNDYDFEANRTEVPTCLCTDTERPSFYGVVDLSPTPDIVFEDDIIHMPVNPKDLLRLRFVSTRLSNAFATTFDEKVPHILTSAPIGTEETLYTLAVSLQNHYNEKSRAADYVDHPICFNTYEKALAYRKTLYETIATIVDTLNIHLDKPAVTQLAIVDFSVLLSMYSNKVITPEFMKEQKSSISKTFGDVINASKEKD